MMKRYYLNIFKYCLDSEKLFKNKVKILVDGRDAHTSYTQAQSLDGRLVQKNISSTNENILTNSTCESQAKSREQNFYLKDILKCLKILKRYQKL